MTVIHRVGSCVVILRIKHYDLWTFVCSHRDHDRGFRRYFLCIKLNVAVIRQRLRKQPLQ